MAKKLDKLLFEFEEAVRVQQSAYANAKVVGLSDEAAETFAAKVRDAANALRGKYGDLERKYTDERSTNSTLREKIRELTPPAPPVEYEAFDAAKVKSGDTVEVRDVSKFGQFAPWRATTFVCIAPRTGLVITETDMQANAHQTENVRMTKRSRDVKMFAHVFDLNGSVAGTLSSVAEALPPLPEGMRHVGNNVPVTITVAE